MVNYDMPRSAEDYVHRIGRTGRNAHGWAVSILTDSWPQNGRFVGRSIRCFLRCVPEKSTVQKALRSGQWWVFTDDSVLVGATTKWNWHSVDLCAKDNEQDSMSLIAKVIKDSGPWT